MKKAVFYARVSSDLQQKERSIESQLAELRRQIEKAGHKLIQEYVDDGYSGALLDRPAMNNLRADLKSDKFETIYILNADRIARDVTYQNIIVGEILRHKKQLIINGKDYISNPENKFTLTVLGAVSELERAKLIERVTRGRQHRLKQGILLGNGHHLYGYTYSRKTKESWPSYAINEAEAKVVLYAFQKYANGQIGIRTISRQLEKMGVPMIKGRNCLNQSSLRHILGNRTYLGVRYFNTMKESRIPQDPLSGTKKDKRIYTPPSEWIGIKIPAIISQELYDKVQKRLRFNEECYRNSKQPQLLSQLVWCDQCGTRCYAYRRFKRRVVYACRSRATKSHISEINGHVLESCTFELIESAMFDAAKLGNHVDLLKRKKRSNGIKVQRQLKKLDKKIESITTQKSRIVDLYAARSIDSDEYFKRIRDYERQLKDLKDERGKLTKFIPLFQKIEVIERSIIEFCSQAKVDYEKCKDFQSRRQFLLDRISKVTFDRRNRAYAKIKIYGSIPVRIENEEPIPVEFKVERVMDWHEYQACLAKAPRQNSDYFRAPVSSCSGNLLLAGRKQATL